MWITFALGVAVCVLLLYLPGFIILRGFNVCPSLSAALAPGISLSLVVGFSTALGLAGIEASWISILIPVLLFCVVVRFAARRLSFEPHVNRYRIGAKCLLLFLAVGLITTTIYYVKNLNGPDSFAQLFDNGYHLNLITAFLDVRRFSILQATTFPTSPIEPMGDISFYPAAWHIIAALCSDALGASSALGENVANTALVGVVFPLSMCAFLSRIFSNNRRIVVFAAACVMAFAAFPWGFLAYGPLYSNIAAFSILPIAMFAFMMMIEPQSFRHHVASGCLFLAAAFSVAVSQPNAVFTAAVVLLPYLCVCLYRTLASSNYSRWRVAAPCFFAIIVVILFLAVRHVSLFSTVVNYPWEAYTQSWKQAVIDFLDLGFRNSAEQIVLGAFVFAGIVASLARRRYRWLIPSYLYFMSAYVVCGAFNPENIFGSYLSGYWYNDADRIAACAAFSMIPLASIGIYAVCRVVVHAIRGASKHVNHRIIEGAFVVAFVLVVFAPSGIIAYNGYHESAFGVRGQRIAEIATTNVSLTEDEILFLDKVKETVGDALVINLPNDGSCFAYTTNGINTLYRHFFLETDKYHVDIQNNLVNISSSASVKEAVRHFAAQYVLRLDVDSSSMTLYEEHFTPEGWKGISEVNDNSAGFETVLSQGDMRLYRIV